MYTTKRKGWFKHIDFICLDVVVANLSFVLAYYFRFQNNVLVYKDLASRNICILISLILFIVDITSNNFHDVLKRDVFTEIKQVAFLYISTLALTSVYLFATKTGSNYSRLFVGYSGALFVVFDFAARMLLKLIVIRIANNSKRYRRTLYVLTDKKTEEKVKECIGKIKIPKYEVKKICYLDKNFDYEKEANYICYEWIDEVLVYLPLKASRPENFISACKEMGLTIHNVLPDYDEERGKRYIEKMGGVEMVTATINFVSPLQSFLKRAIDIFASVFGCLATLVIALIIGPIIKSKSPGPIFFSQIRIGQNGQKFKFYKFRSMYMDAEERKKDLMKQNRVQDGLMFKLDDDPRIIKGIGNFIRKTSLDEFPQFWNVLKGDMSLVGTRPPTLDEWNKYEYHHRARMATKPGITGLWQVSGRSKITDFEEVVKLDLEYIRNFSLFNDIKILLKTAKVLLKKDSGAM